MIFLVGIAHAADVDLGGSVKTFVVGTFPYEVRGVAAPPTGVGIAAGRLKAGVSAEKWHFEVHHELSVLTSPTASPTTDTGVANSAPEAVDLSWVATDESLVVQGRIDRLVAGATIGPVEIDVGRQAISFGSGQFFTPLDLVNPFTPATIDTEYKPGVDALRVDVYPSASSRIALVAAYAGDWNLDGSILAAYGQGTVGVTDIGGFLGIVHGDPVLGTSIVSSAGPVGLHGDATVTLADEPFVRGVVGIDGRPGSNTTISGEIYVQTLGETDPAKFFALATDPPWTRGELWLFGVVYGAVAVHQQVTPLLGVSAAVIANPIDPSFFVAPAIGWSVSENAEVGFGGYVGVGQRPRTQLRSEFGTYPAAAFLQVRTYF